MQNRKPKLFILLSIWPKNKHTKTYRAIASALNDNGTDSINKGESTYLNQKEMVMWRRSWTLTAWDFDKLLLEVNKYLFDNSDSLKSLSKHVIQLSFVAYSNQKRTPGLTIENETISLLSNIGATIDIDWY